MLWATKGGNGLIEWKPGIQVAEKYVPFMDELEEELFYGPWDPSDSIEVRILPLTFDPGKSYRPGRSSVCGLSSIGINPQDGNPFVVVWTPPTIIKNHHLYTAAHETAHIVLGHVNIERLTHPERTVKLIPWQEVQANDWAEAKLKAWQVKITPEINMQSTVDFFWMMEEAKKCPELMEVAKEHPRASEFLFKRAPSPCRGGARGKC